MFGRMIAALLLVSTPARAGWMALTTTHFTVYIDTDEAEARRYVGRLEQFDAALRRLYGVADDPPSADTKLQRLTVFALRPEAFQKACGCGAVLGYYMSGPGGSVVVSQHQPKADAHAAIGRISPQSVLLHEYSHHFMAVHFPSAYPLWYREGFAEFNSYVEYRADGSIVLGLPANDRSSSIEWNPETLISFEGLLTGKGNTYQIYGRGWLLTHYLMLYPKRQGQLGAYLVAVGKGKDSVSAAEGAFGDLRQLAKELDAYAEGHKLFAPWRIPGSVRPAEIAIRPLTPAEIAILPIHVRSISGVSQPQTRYVAADARRVARAFPADSGVLVTLAETEFAARNWDAAAAAADQALGIRADDIDALVWRGRAAVEKARADKTRDPAIWKQARGWYLKANRLDPDAATPLLYYYESFPAGGVPPSDGGITGLKRAAVLAPEDTHIRRLLGERMLIEGETEVARSLLASIAFAPHAKTDDRANKIIALIDAGKLAEAKQMSATLAPDDPAR